MKNQKCSPIHSFLLCLCIAKSSAQTVTSNSQADKTTATLKPRSQNWNSNSGRKILSRQRLVLMSSTLVLMMTGPGLALFYGGLVRKKNVLATMMQCFTLMAVVTVLWALFGYSLAFDAGNRFVGSYHHAFLHGVGIAPDADYAATIPQQTFMVFQLMFAIITPALITGAFAGSA